MTHPQRVALVHLYSNGDCLFATTIARQIKKDHPGCHLTWVIASFCKNIVALDPDVDEVREVTIAKNDTAAFRRLKRTLQEEVKQGRYDRLFISHNADTNHAYYDGCTRSSILSTYPGKITVPTTPVLSLSKEETEHARAFADRHRLSTYKHVILFEFAPLSGQLKITREGAIRIAEAIVQRPDTAIILSSANAIDHPDPRIIDGSPLTLRETAALTHHCNFLLGCSSGITWISTSSAAKPLPMVQMLDPDVTWVNPVSRDFERFGGPVGQLIELIRFDEAKVAACVLMALDDMAAAKAMYNEPVPLHFRTTRSIVYNLLCYLEFGAIIRHIRVNTQRYGHRADFYKELIMGFLTFPFTLIRNVVRKRLLKRK